MRSKSEQSLYVGTAGWSYPRGAGAWDGIFYPRGMADRDKLSFYAQYLDAVEVNSTFYRPIGPDTTRLWSERTPETFRFNIKLNQKFTHPKMFEATTGEAKATDETDVAAFKRGLEPIASAEKLGALLAQFPASFKCEPANLEYLESLIQEFREYPMSVELRHRGWTDSPETAELFREYDVSWTMIDEPKFKTSIRHVPLTSRLGYFRFHGRNFKDWWHGDRESRYDYLYSPSEQAHLQEDVRQVAEKADLTFVVYNNHFGGKAIVNAIETKQALGGATQAELPAPLLELKERSAEKVESRAR